MIIKSRWKDYYDYVMHANGGGDPLCVYMRDYVKEDKRIFGTLSESTVDVKSTVWLPNYHRNKDGTVTNHRGLCVAGRFFILAQEVRINPANSVEVPVNYWRVVRDTYKDTYHPGMMKDSIVRLAKEVAAPVFWFQGKHNWGQVVLGRTPKLEPIGIGSFLTGEQLYQELAMFLSNELRPAEQADTPRNDVAKAESHGFDKRVSFRHRK